MPPNAPTPGNQQLQLRDVVVTLQRQNQMLADVVQNTQGTESQLNSFISYLERRDQKDHLEETERAAEARKESTRQLTSNAGPGRASTSKAGGGGLFGGGNWLKTGAIAGAVAGMGPMLLGAALRSIPFAIAVAFGKEIEQFFGGGEFGAMVANSAIGGLFGMIFGKKLAVLGTVLGAIYTPERAAAAEKALGDLGGNIKEGAIKALAYLGLSLPSLLTIANTIGDGAVKGLQGLADLTSGDLDKFKENWKEAAIVLGTMAAIFAPKGWIMGIIRFLGSKRAFLAGIASLLGITVAGAGIAGEEGGGVDPVTAGVGAAAGVWSGKKAFDKTQTKIEARTGRTAAQAAASIPETAKGQHGTIPENMRDKVRYSKRSGELHKVGQGGITSTERATAADVRRVQKNQPPKKGWWRAAMGRTKAGKAFLTVAGSAGRLVPAVTAALIILDGYEMYQIYYGEGPYAGLNMEEKKQEMGKLLGSIMGTVALVSLGVALGTAAGVTFFAPLAWVGTILGGVAGGVAAMYSQATWLGVLCIDALFFAGNSETWSKASQAVKDIAAQAGEANLTIGATGDTISGGGGNATSLGSAGTDNLSGYNLLENLSYSSPIARGGKNPSISAIGNGFMPNQMGMPIGGRGDNSPIVNVDASTTQAASSQFTLNVDSPVNDPHDVRMQWS